MPVRRARPIETNDTFSNGDFIDQIIVFLGQNWWWLVALLVIFVTALVMIRSTKKKYLEIQKLWVFTLFFLTKRQMMIPLVIGLSKKDKILDKSTQTKLMEIREHCREVSFKKSPIARLKLETEVSEILFNYFSKIEKSGQLKTGTKFHKIVQDLEFIDAKLVQLQTIYNSETQRWNKKLNLPGLQPILKTFGIKTFEPFN